METTKHYYTRMGDGRREWEEGSNGINIEIIVRCAVVHETESMHSRA
jgi:hypothetical protein